MQRNRRTLFEKCNTKRGVGRILTFCFVLVLALQVTVTPVDAFSFGGLLKKVSKKISAAVSSVRSLVDTSSEKTVYSYAELDRYMSSLFAPKDIKVKLGGDIYVPSNKTITSVRHKVTMDMQGRTIYSDNPNYTMYLYFQDMTIQNGTFVQRVSNSEGFVYAGDSNLTIKDVSFKKSSSASRVTGLSASGIIGSPNVELTNVTFDGLTTGISLRYGAKATLNNSNIKNSQGDAVTLSGYNDKKPTFTMKDGAIKYFKGNGINAADKSVVTLDNVIVTGGTTRNRYGILVGKNATSVNLNGNTKVYGSAGGNIGVYREGIKPVIASIDTNNKYSFTVVDGLDGYNPVQVATVEKAPTESIRALPVRSDISRYMVLGGNSGNSEIRIQNPPSQCVVNAQVAWTCKKNLQDKDENYATVSVNGGSEAENGGVTVKYDAKVTLSTTNTNPERYEFLGWYKSVDGQTLGEISKAAVCQIDAIDENATYQARYAYKQYTITVNSSGKGAVTASVTGQSTSVNTGSTGTASLTCYVDDTVTLAATPSTNISDKTYNFNKWNDGDTNASRSITVSKNETYTGMFKKTGQDTGTMYLGVKEITKVDELKQEDNLLLIYVGAVGNAQNNKLEASSGNVGTTGLPDNSAMLTSKGLSSSHGRTKADKIASDGINGYGYGVTPNQTMLSVDVKQSGSGFDTCSAGYIDRYTFTRNNKQETCWLYWCNRGGVNAVGPFALYSYTSSKKFKMNDVKIEMADGFKPTTKTDIIDKSKVNVYVTVDNTRYDLGGLKFEADDLDNKINYTEGDKLINFELDGVTVDYNFPEAKIGNEQYTTLSQAISKAKENGEPQTISIVGPGVDSIDVENPVALGEGDKIEGYDQDSVTAKENSKIGIDRNGTVRLTNGALYVAPGERKETSIGVKDAFAKTDKKITVTTDGEEKSVIKPDDNGTKLQISPDNNPDHLVTISDAKNNNTYEFKQIPKYGGETVTIGKETEYTVNVPKTEGDETTAITTSKYNTGNTTIANGDDGKPEITSSKEGDKVTVGGNTYVTGKTSDEIPTKYRVNPDQSAKPSVILESGQLGIPVGTTIGVNGKNITNTGAKDLANPVQISADGKIDIPNGAGVTIGNLQIQVPNKTPMNGNTTVTLDKNGKPQIRTTGDSEVKLVVKKEGEPVQEITYQVGDYDCVLSVGEDGIPVIEDGEIKLQPGQVIKDRLGNEYRCPNDAANGITIMTTPQVYETDEQGNIVPGKDGKPILVGGGDMSFVIPQGKAIECKPAGSATYETFENPGDGEGFFSLDPANAEDGIKSDSELGLAAGKTIGLSVGDHRVDITAPKTGNSGTIQVDGSTGSVKLLKANDSVIIGGKKYTAQKDNTVFIVDENGVTLSQGQAAGEKGVALGYQGIDVTDQTGNNAVSIKIGQSTEEVASSIGATIETTGGAAFDIAPVGSSEKVSFVTEAGNHSYPLGADGSVTLPNGQSITRKSGASSVQITAGDADITMKPLTKPKSTEADAAPIGGLLLEVPTGKSITIGNKTYKEPNAEAGEPNSPMQLVLEESGKVVLYGGTAELSKGADILLYNVENKLVNFKNTSSGDQTVQVTSPGIAAMPQVGTSVTMGSGSSIVEFTTTVDNTQIAYTSEVCLLKQGGVTLNSKEKILVGDMVVTNTNSSGDIKVTMNETGSDDSCTYSGTITVPNGKVFSLSSPGANQTITYRSNVEGGGGEATFTINSDGNLVFPQGGIAELKDTSGKVTQVQAGKENIETLPTPDGAMYAIPKDGYIVVGGKQYTNKGNAPLVLEVQKDGKVVLVQGDVVLSDGAIVYVQNEKEKFVPIENTSNSSESGSGNSSELQVSYEGVTEKTGEAGSVVETYPDVKVSVQTGGTVTIGDNEYTSVSNGESGATLTLDISKDNESSTAGDVISGKQITLTNGTVDLGTGSSVSVAKDEAGNVKKLITNLNKTDKGEVKVNSSAQVDVSTGSTVQIEDTKISVPGTDDASDDYKAVVDLTGEDTNSLKVTLSPKVGETNVGTDKKVVINDNTYVSVEENQNLSLQIHNDDNDKVTLTGDSTKVGLVDGATIVVGDTTVTSTTDKTVIVTEKTESSTKVPELDVPAGGEANLKNDSNHQDISVKVPEKTDGAGETAAGQKFTVDTEGNVSTDLKKDETVVIGGVEYTGTETDENKDTIKVNGQTGELTDKTDNGSKPNITIDAALFNKPGYVYKVANGGNITVNGVTYHAPDVGMELLGNPDGNPIVKISAGNSVVIGGKTYTAGGAETQFAVANNGSITLVSGSLVFRDREGHTVNGTTFRGSKDSDAYTVSTDGSDLSVKLEAGAKVSVDMPADSKLSVIGQIAMETKDEDGKTVTKTGNGTIPVTMQNGSGRITLDQSKEGATNTALLQIASAENIKVSYNSQGNIQKVEVLQKKATADGGGAGGGAGAGGAGGAAEEEKKESSIVISDDSTETAVEVPVEVKEDKVIVDTIPKDVIDQLVETQKDGKKVVALDGTSLKKPAVVLDVETLDNIASKGAFLKVITVSAEVTIDKQASAAIIGQASGDLIEIRVEKKESDILNEAQKETIKNYKVEGCLKAFVQSNGVEIHDFKKGTVRVSIPWKVAAGRKAELYQVYYIDNQGKMSRYDTTYANGKLWFETNHFSEYVVVYEGTISDVTPAEVDETPLLARVTRSTKTSLKVKWNKVKGAEKYVIYAADYSASGKLKKVATVGANKSSFTVKKLQPGTRYKLLVKPVGKTNLKKSLVLYAATKGGTYKNVSKLSVDTKRLTMKVGSKKKLKVKYKADANSVKKGKLVRYVSSNKAVATVSKNGVIKAKKAGNCTIYAVLSSGKYVPVKVTVK